jgi:hypothetical protein
VPPIVIIAIIAVLTVAGAAVAIGVVHEKRRRAALETVGAGLGLSYQRDGRALLGQMRSHIPLFQRGHSRRARNVLSGEIEDLIVHVFDFSYTIRSGKNNRTYRQTVVVFGGTATGMPAFALAPERFGHRIAEKLFGMQDIDFEAYPEFSRRYRLSGADEAAIRARFDASLLEFLERQDRLNLEAGGGWLVVFRQGRRVKPEGIGAFLEEAFTIRNRLG